MFFLDELCRSTRRPSSKSNNSSFSEFEKRQVFDKARIFSLMESNERRLDICGREIRFSHYGRTDSSYGWEIDHIHPVAKGGLDSLSNLQPLYWLTNRKKGDSVGVNFCLIGGQKNG